MEIEIAAILTVACKLELLEKLLDRRIMRAALDVTSPALPLLQNVYRLGEYKRLAANLAVMDHRIRCALGEEQAERIVRAAKRVGGADLCGRQVKAALKRARGVLCDLHVLPPDLLAYRQLPLYRAECDKLRRIQNAPPEKQREKTAALPFGVIHCANDAAYAYCSDGRTAQA